MSHRVGGMKSEDKNFNRSRNLRSEVTKGGVGGGKITLQ